MAGIPYLQQLETNVDDAAEVTWELASGALPTGLTLSPDGTISGTPVLPDDAEPGTTIDFKFQVKATASPVLVVSTGAPLLNPGVSTGVRIRSLLNRPAINIWSVEQRF
jgi:hypothetical protein